VSSPTYAHKRAHWASYADPQARKGREGRPYKRWKAKVLSPPVLVCHRCGDYIDKALPWRHPMSATAGHIIPLTIAPHLALDERNGAPEHRRCNIAAGNGTSKRVITFPREATTRTVATRRW
jgi:hypothetical protein